MALSKDERAGIAVFATLGWGFAAIYVGFLLGAVSSGFSSPDEVGSTAARGALCAVPPMILAALTRRVWILPSLVYFWIFSAGYSFGDELGYALQSLIPLRVATLPPAYPELPWIYAIALWATLFASYLRSMTCRQGDPAAA